MVEAKHPGKHKEECADDVQSLWNEIEKKETDIKHEEESEIQKDQEEEGTRSEEE